jgi:hypothetical protein
MVVCRANVNQPLTSLVANNNCDSIKIRNYGSHYSKLNLGTTSTTTYPGYIYDGAAGTSAINVEIKRVYTSATRLGVVNLLNSLSTLTMENVHANMPFLKSCLT